MARSGFRRTAQGRRGVQHRPRAGRWSRGRLRRGRRRLPGPRGPAQRRRHLGRPRRSWASTAGSTSRSTSSTRSSSATVAANVLSTSSRTARPSLAIDRKASTAQVIDPFTSKLDASRQDAPSLPTATSRSRAARSPRSTPRPATCGPSSSIRNAAGPLITALDVDVRPVGVRRRGCGAGGQPVRHRGRHLRRGGHGHLRRAERRRLRQAPHRGPPDGGRRPDGRDHGRRRRRHLRRGHRPAQP